MDLSLLLQMAAQGMPDRVFLGSAAAGTTFSELESDAKLLADILLPGQPVAYAGPHGVVAVRLLFACAAAGAPFAPVNSRLPHDQIAALIRRLEPAVLVCADELAEALAGTAATVVPVSRLGDLTSLPLETPARERSSTAALLYTSGTTATPKAAVLSHANLLAYVMETLDFASAGEDECLLMAVPPFHVAGIAAVLSNTYVGRRVVVLPLFEAGAWLRAVREEGVTHAFVVPTMLARIVAAMQQDPSLRCPSLRSLSYGGARMPLPVLESALALFPDTDFVNAYGLTETSSTIAVLGPADHRPDPGDPVGAVRLTSVGRVLPSVELQVIDEDGNPLPLRTSGRVRMRGAQVGGSYLGVGSTLDEDGWLVTGDLGSIDEDGYLFLEGRADDVVIRGGENIAPAEVEDALLRYPGVAQAVVLGVPDGEWGERLVATLVPADGVDLDLDAVREHVRTSLGSLKTPDRLVVRDELPLTATGKVLKRVLQQELSVPSKDIFHDTVFTGSTS
jgi:acyl-CoA synthetase (AMP-forming)/AMP-acid ligase II